MTHTTEILKDPHGRQLNITREFSAPVEKVWKAWTEAEQLDKWWAPKPWKAITKSMDFKVGGFWLYCMAGPNGEKAWCRVDFTAINEGQSFEATATFSDEDGNIDKNFPPMHWHNEFMPTMSGSKVEIELSFNSEAGLEQIVKMGFKEGFSMGLGNLDELLAEQ
jgi:uncharacterized protein YndB with AHSA1/START domain